MDKTPRFVTRRSPALAARAKSRTSQDQKGRPLEKGPLETGSRCPVDNHSGDRRQGRSKLDRFADRPGAVEQPPTITWQNTLYYKV
jgi:hypothetical protein